MSAAPAVVRTPRLILRPVSDEDAGPTSRLVTPDIAEQLSTWPSPMSEEQALEKIRASRDLLAELKSINFAILRRENQELLGWAGLWLVSDRSAKIGYWIGTPFRRQGFTKEALTHAIPAAKRILNFTLVEALVLPGNEASRSLLGELGFVEDGEEDEFIVNQGRSRTCIRHLLDVSGSTPSVT